MARVHPRTAVGDRGVLFVYAQLAEAFAQLARRFETPVRPQVVEPRSAERPGYVARFGIDRLLLATIALGRARVEQGHPFQSPDSVEIEDLRWIRMPRARVAPWNRRRGRLQRSAPGFETAVEDGLCFMAKPAQ